VDQEQLMGANNYNIHAQFSEELYHFWTHLWTERLQHEVKLFSIIWLYSKFIIFAAFISTL